MKSYRKRDYPMAKIRRYLEPGPIVLVSSAWKGKTNIMTMGWHMMLGFSPALFGCYIWDGNRSSEMLRRSEECVINLPTTNLVDAVVGIGNCTGEKNDKFKKFGLTPVPGEQIETRAYQIWITAEAVTAATSSIGSKLRLKSSTRAKNTLQAPAATHSDGVELAPLLARRIDKTVGRESLRQSLSCFTLRGLLAIVVGLGVGSYDETASADA